MKKKTTNSIILSNKELVKVLSDIFHIDGKVNLDFEIQEKGDVDLGNYQQLVKSLTITYDEKSIYQPCNQCSSYGGTSNGCEIEDSDWFMDIKPDDIKCPLWDGRGI